MSEDLNLKFTLTDLASSNLRKIESQITSLGKEGAAMKARWAGAKEAFTAAQEAFGTTATLWQTAVVPGVQAAGELQGSMLKAETALNTLSKPAYKLRSELAAFKATAMQVGNPLPLDTTQILEAETALSKVGLAVDDIVGAKGAAAASSFIAVMESMNPQQAAEIIGDVGSQFQLAGAQYFDLADNISKASDASSTSASEMAEGLKYVAATAKRLGVDYRTTLAIMGQEAKVGLKGSTAGTSLNSFLTRLAVPGSGEAVKAQKQAGLNFYDPKGQFVGIDAALAQLRKAEAKLSQAQREKLRQTLFGEEGGRVAAALLDNADGYKGITAAMADQRGLEEKVGNLLKGHQGQLEAIKGTISSIVAEGFMPLTDLLTEGETKLAGMLADLAAFQGQHQELSAGISGLAVAGLGAGALYGVGKLAQGGGQAASVLLDLVRGKGGGAAGLAAGVAQGKILEQLGVQPVFVTNWPGGSSPLDGVQSAAGTVATTGGIAETAGTAATVAGAAGATGMLGKAAGLAGKVAGVAGAGMLGYEVGSLIQSGLESQGWDIKIQNALATGLAALGSDFGKAILADRASQAPQVNVSVSVDQAGQAKVKSEAGLDNVRVQARRGLS